ncbi:immunity 53 family protein [Streptomyces sp. NPDC047024]|uniref:immunity 53 family protein n=1 Tax=Streptomyces sp. NPDC047024 TaxID=3155476 RepID=UPI003405DA08
MPEIKPTDPEAERASGRVPLWLDAEDLRRLAVHCGCSEDTPEEDRERCGRIRFRASAALHKHGTGSEDVLEWLQGWYAAQCDGDWEHEWGVKIETLDNPGWSVEISLEETELADREHPQQRVTRGGNDWVTAWTSGQTFRIACGPDNLSEALSLFRSWASSEIVKEV